MFLFDKMVETTQIKIKMLLNNALIRVRPVTKRLIGQCSNTDTIYFDHVIENQDRPRMHILMCVDHNLIKMTETAYLSNIVYILTQFFYFAESSCEAKSRRTKLSHFLLFTCWRYRE